MKKLTSLVALVLSIVLPVLAVAEEPAATPEPVPAEEILAYTQVYEPETSFVLSSTVAWNADETALEVAGAQARPATALVYVDADLRVTDAAGKEIAPSLADYISATAGTVIPALYVSDAEAAAALKFYLIESGLGDVFVAASYENAALVKDVADLNPVRGLVDFRGIVEADEDTLDDIIATTNGSHAKVCLISQEIATEENVQYLQGRCSTVWVATSSDQVSLLTQYTNGANGVLVDDYQAALDTLAFFQDDAPSLLRPSLIVGHRGMPSEYIENTTLSAIGAYAAGADAIENDIHLTADRKIIINHDESLARLFNRPDVENLNILTLEEILSIPFVNDTEKGVQAANNQNASKSRYGYIRYLPSQRMPTLREFFELFKDSGVVHDTEIKTNDPAIVVALRTLVNEYDNFGEVFTISFNVNILEEMYNSWPEMSVGALGMEGYAKEGSNLPMYQPYGDLIESGEATVEECVAMLYAELDKWNATYNPSSGFSYDVISAGRHRGLTVWPWTYNSAEGFAEAYLNGIYGLTTNFSYWASDFIVDLDAEDVDLTVGEPLPAPVVTTQNGQQVSVEGLEAIALEGSLDEEGQALMIYRLKQDLVIDGVSYGSYYLYSNPFTVTVTAP
mgnify:FL=1